MCLEFLKLPTSKFCYLIPLSNLKAWIEKMKNINRYPNFLQVFIFCCNLTQTIFQYTHAINFLRIKKNSKLKDALTFVNKIFATNLVRVDNSHLFQKIIFVKTKMLVKLTFLNQITISWLLAYCTAQTHKNLRLVLQTFCGSIALPDVLGN